MRAAPIVLVALVVACGQRPNSKTERPPMPPPQSAPQPARKPPSPASVVEEFGKRLKNVPLLATKEKAAEAIRTNYADLVEPALVARWIDDPASAPGRKTSSPWPDRIEIESTDASTHDEAMIRGVVVEVTSTGEADRTPVQISLRSTGGRWLISSFEELTDSAAAVRVVQQYYDAIASRDFKKAYALWGASGPPGQSFQQFVDGFRDTASVAEQTGEPGRIGAAAGSRYIDVPVKVNATTSTGAKQTFEGTYTLRRSVVDGATADQRAWRLYRASLHLVRR